MIRSWMFHRKERPSPTIIILDIFVGRKTL